MLQPDEADRGQVEVQVNTERVWNEPWPVIQVRYRNITQVNFRLVRDDWSRHGSRGRGRPEWLDDEDRKALLAKKPEHAWAVQLPATKDYQERTEEIPVPKDLKPGFYFLLASPDPGFGDQDNVVVFTDVWVSSLALVMRSHWDVSVDDDVLEGFVLDGNSGDPIPGAEVQAWCDRFNVQLQRGEDPDRPERPVPLSKL